MDIEKIRLNKLLSERGICSRREADRLIEAGKVKVDGHVAVMGEKVDPSCRLHVNGKQYQKTEKPARILLALNKPVGIVCTAEKREKKNIIDFLDYPERVYPVGRLDKDSSGLILMTNWGDMVNRMMRSGNCHEKEYVVKVDHPLTEKFLRGMEKGVPILDTVTRPCKVTRTNTCEFHIVLTQGLNRQIRRMCEYFGYQVKELKRIRIMDITLGSLKPGEYREVSEKEIEIMWNQIKDSSNTTVIETGERNGRTYGKNQRTHKPVK